MHVIKKAAIVYASHRPGAKDLAKRVGQTMKRERVDFTLIEAKPSADALDPGRMNVDLLVTIGGDGTLLKSVGCLPNPKTVVFGINLGTRGLLTEVESKSAPKAVERVLREEYEVEETSRISVYIGEKWIGDALNEAYMCLPTPGKLFNFIVEQAGARLMEGAADGCIVATAVGSTAYSLSAGGPIIDPSLNAVVVTPVSPFSNLRPLVLSARKPIEVKADEEVQVVIDGWRRTRTRGETMKLVMSDHPAKFIRIGEGDSFVRRTERRLKHSG